MKRYQVYLNSNSVSVLDEYGQHTNISRSQLIQMAVDQIAQNLRKVFIATKIPTGKKYILDTLVGSIKVKGTTTTNFANNIDEIYLQD